MTTIPAPEDIAETFLSTTSYQTALTVHAGQPACPTPGDPSLPSWYPDGPDDDYRYCCRTQYGANYVETLTSGPGPGGRGTSLKACCQRSFLCTGVAPFVFDWSVSTEVVSLSDRTFVRPTIVIFPLTTGSTPAGGGGGGGQANGAGATTVTQTATATATVTITTAPVIVVGGVNDGRLTNAEVAGTVVAVATFLVAVFTLYLGYTNPPAWLRQVMERLHRAQQQPQSQPQLESESQPQLGVAGSVDVAVAQVTP